MRVLHVITDLNTGGAEVMLYRLLRAASDGTSHDVVSLTDLGAVAEPIERLGIQPRALHLTRLPSPLKIARLASLMGQLRPDVVQTWMYHSDLIGGLAARLNTRAKVVWGIHSSHLDPAVTHRTTRWAIALCARFSYRVPDRIVAVSRVSRAIHIAAGYAPSKFVCIPNGFDLDEYHPDAERRYAVRRDLGLYEDDVAIGLIARVHPQKDHRTFIRAAALLSSRVRNLRFLLSGEGTTEANTELVGEITRAGLLDRFLLLGRRSDVPSIMNALDIAALSSSFGEAFPLVIGEAMASGVPCVATDVGDSAHLAGETGRIVPPRDPEALARAWEDLVRLGPDGRRRLGMAARDRIASQFSLPRIASRYVALYESLLSGASAETAAADADP